jgi:hypothetical protein
VGLIKFSRPFALDFGRDAKTSNAVRIPDHVEPDLDFGFDPAAGLNAFGRFIWRNVLVLHSQAGAPQKAAPFLSPSVMAIRAFRGAFSEQWP